jgi:hypothetical protein
MFESKPTYEAFYLPGPQEFPTEEALKLGLGWLLAQPPTPLIVLSAKNMLGNNRLLAQTVQRYRIQVAAPPRMFEAHWTGGSILAPWASERALLAIDEELNNIQAVCVIGWSKDHHDTWIAGHHARDLRDPAASPVEPTLDPVVVVAMTHASRAVNHNNALVQEEDKAYVVRTLQELVRAGYRYDVEQLVAWAIANGWYPAEIPRLRDYATRVRNGGTFRLRDTYGPQRGAATEWAREAEAGIPDH